MTQPTPVTPIDATGADVADRLGARVVDIPPALLDRLVASGAEVVLDDDARAEAGRDWWPLAIGWAAEGAVPQRPAVVVRPSSTEEVSAVLAACNEAAVPVTAAAGRSGVCGGSIPVHGGVALDMTALDGLREVDETSLRADVRAGTFGPDLETALGEVGAGYTLGHWPQSMDLSTVGGWLACRGAGQYSTRYGKIEDMVIGLEVVLADGRVVHTEGKGPRAATGPNLTQLFVGSEGTLGVITEARLRVHPLPPAQERRAFGFSTFAEGLEACRRILRRGATPAVLRLYDQTESERNFDEGDTNVLIVLDEADLDILAGTMKIVDAECSTEAGAQPLDHGLVDRWLGHRNDVSALAPLWRGGIVVDTAEISGPWSALSGLFDEVVGALKNIDGTLAASAHQSHAYPDGACLYFTFGGRGPDGDDEWRERYYRQAWDTVTDATLAHGAAISHHHGIGLNRSRFLPRALGTGFEVLRGLKATFDPNGHPQPREIRPRLALWTGALGMSQGGGSILVVDVGTSGVRAAIVRPDATVEHEHRVPLLPDSPAPGLVEFDAARMADAVLEVARASLAGRRPGGRSRDRQPARLEHRLGARHREASGARHRLAGPAHGRDLPRPPSRRHPSRTERVGHQGDGHPRRGRPGTVSGRARGALLRDRRQLGGLDALRGCRTRRRRAARHRRHQRGRDGPGRRDDRMGRAVAAQTADPVADDAGGRRLFGNARERRRSSRSTAHLRDRR